MDDMNKDPQQLSPEDQLDLLLEKFLSDPNDEVPTLEETLPSEDSVPEITEESLEISQDQPEPASPEEQLDDLLASFQDLSGEPLPEEASPAEEALEMPELVSFWDIIPDKDASAAAEAAEEESPTTEDDEVIPVILPIEDATEDADASAEEETAEEEPAEDDEVDAPEEEDGAVTPVILPVEDAAEDADASAEEEAAEEEPIEDDEVDATEEDDDPVIPVVLPIEDATEDTDAPAEEEAAEEEPIEDDDDDAPEEDDDEVIPVILPVEDVAENADAPAEEEAAEEEPAEDNEEDAPEEEDGAVIPVILPIEDVDEDTDTPSEESEEVAPVENTEASEKTDEETQDPEKEQSPEESGAGEDGSQKDNAEKSTDAAEPKKETDAPKEETTSDTEEEDKEDTEPPAPPKKRRPRNTKTYGFFGIPHLLTTIIWLGIVVFIGVGLGKAVWNCAADVLALGRPDSQVVITITDDDDLQSIADKLKATGLIKYPSLFVIYGDISDAMDTIRTGTFKLNTMFDYHALVDAMSSNQRRETTSVTIPEGYTCAQMFRLLESKGVSTVAKLEAAAASGDLGDYWFLEGVERGTANCLEGFLFPDTYTFYLDHDPVGVLTKFLDNFNKRFNESMKIKLDTLNQTLSEKMRANGLSEEYIAAHQMTVRDVVIIASMIEKETASNPESYNISSVIYNRLTNPEVYPFLNIDAALVYVLGHGDLTLEDLKYDSPYNTYLYPGLIPGAISNPGAYSLDAALDPTETDYYYYALDPSTGSHHFSKTLKEHNDFLESIRKEEPEEEPQE